MIFGMSMENNKKSTKRNTAINNLSVRMFGAILFRVLKVGPRTDGEPPKPVERLLYTKIIGGTKNIANQEEWQEQSGLA